MLKFSNALKKYESHFFSQLAANWLPYPIALHIEPINVCQLRCPLCPTGLRKLNYAPQSMSFETFQAILAKLPFVKIIGLYRAGEPFLNPDLQRMIRFASAKDIYVFISSNFSFAKPDEFFDDLVASGLNRLIISLDGTCEETYATYRVDGNFELVLDNMKKMVAAKKRVHSKTPEIIWQFLVNRFNEDEIDTAKAMAINLGVTLDLKLMDVSDNLVDVELDTTLEQRKAHWLGRNQKYICERYKNEIHYPVFKGICAELFTDLVVTVDGKVLPCCGTWDKNSTFGDLLTQSFHDIWFGQQYVNSRLKFFKKDFYPEVTTTCFRCLNFGTDPSWKDKLRLLGVILQKRILMPMYVLLQSYKGR